MGQLPFGAPPLIDKCRALTFGWTLNREWHESAAEYCSRVLPFWQAGTPYLQALWAHPNPWTWHTDWLQPILGEIDQFWVTKQRGWSNAYSLDHRDNEQRRNDSTGSQTVFNSNDDIAPKETVCVSVLSPWQLYVLSSQLMRQPMWILLNYCETISLVNHSPQTVNSHILWCHQKGLD